MTGNDVFALPLGLMGMHKSEWSLCPLLCAELLRVTRPRTPVARSACCGSSWSVPFLNIYVKVVDIMENYM